MNDQEFSRKFGAYQMKHTITLQGTNEAVSGYAYRINGWDLLAHKDENTVASNAWRVSHFPTGCLFSLPKRTLQAALDGALESSLRITERHIRSSERWPVINSTDKVTFKVPKNTNQLRDAARELHYDYGKGEIIEVRVYTTGQVEIHAQRTSCKPHIARGRAWNNTVKIYGHHRSIK
jgi:hypothetical protein